MPVPPALPGPSAAQKQARAPQKRAAQTRARILRAARELIGRQGYETTRTQDIAERAGVAEGSVFAHFGNKKGLLAGLMQDHYAMLIARAEAIGRAHPDPRDRLAALLDLHLDQLLQNWQLVRVFAHYGRYSEAAMATAFREHNRAYTRIFQTCIEALIGSGAAAELRADLLRDMIFGGAEHWAYRVCELDQPLDREQAAAFLLDRVLAPLSADG